MPSIVRTHFKPHMFTFADMFCGIGGFHVALTDLGGRCVFACDSDAACRQVYRDNFGMEPADDVRNLVPSEVPDHDVLCAGFPCQSFSKAGKQGARNDSRGQLFDVLMDIIRTKRPVHVLLENVRHIKTIDGGKVLEHVVSSLSSEGYQVQMIETSPHHHGVPQLRPRVFFVGTRTDCAPIKMGPLPPLKPFTFDRTESKLDPVIMHVFEAWNEALPILRSHDKGTFPVHLDFFDAPVPNASARDWKAILIRKNQALYAAHKAEWDAWRSKHESVLAQKEVYRRLEWTAGRIASDASLWNQFIQMRPSGIRVKRPDFFPTLVAMVQVPIYGSERRYLTPRECARLQSLPDTFKLHAVDRVAYKQLGNSVNVRCVQCALMQSFLTV